MKTLVGMFALLLCASVSLSQTVTLRSALEPGVSWTFDTTQDMTSDNKAMAMGQVHPFQSKQYSRRGGTITVVQAKNGEATQMKIAFNDKCESWGEMAGNRQNMPFPFAGRTVTVTRDESGRVTSDVDGQADPGTLSEIHGMIEPETVYMPKKPVAIGEEWEADPQGLSRQLGLQTKDDTAGMTLKLLSIKQQPRPTAEVKVSIAIIRNMQGMNTKLIAQGVAMVDIATGHITKLDSQGTTTSSGTMSDQTPDGQQVSFQVEGQGKLTTKSDTPLTNAGNVVAPPVTEVVTDNNNPLVNNRRPGNDGDNPLSPKKQKPTPFSGKFSDGKLTVELISAANGYSGTLSMDGNSFPATATGTDTKLEGSFSANGSKFPFTATLEGGSVLLTSDGTTYKLEREKPRNPLAK